MLFSLNLTSNDWKSFWKRFIIFRHQSKAKISFGTILWQCKRINSQQVTLFWNGMKYCIQIQFSKKDWRNLFWGLLIKKWTYHPKWIQRCPLVGVIWMADLLPVRDIYLKISVFLIEFGKFSIKKSFRSIDKYILDRFLPEASFGCKYSDCQNSLTSIGFNPFALSCSTVDDAPYDSEICPCCWWENKTTIQLVLSFEEFVLPRLDCILC